MSEIKKLENQIKELKTKNKTFINGANEAIGILRDELIKMYKLNYELTCLKQSIFQDIQPEFIQFNESCFHGRLLEDYKKKYNDIKSEIYYFVIFKGNSNYLLLWLNNKQTDEHSKTFNLEYKIPATYVEYKLIMNKLKSSNDIENLNYYKCDIKNIDNVKKLIDEIISN